MTISKNDIHIRYLVEASTAVVICITNPAIKTYFFSHVSQQILAFSNLIEIGLSALIMTGAISDNVISKIKSYITPIIVVDLCLYILASLMGLDNPDIRFVLLAIVNSTTGTVAFVAVKDCVNLHVSGRELTVLQNKLLIAAQLPSFIALAIFMFIDMDMHVDIAIYCQCAIFCFMGVADIYFVKKYGKKEKEEEEE